MKIHFLIAFLACGSFAKAQINLVPNPSFEEYTQCPAQLNYVRLAVGWWDVNNTPDYFNVCDTLPWWLGRGIPKNVLGFQFPFDGNAYAGVVTRDFSNNYREYFGCELYEPVRAGLTYQVSMRVSRGDWWPLASNKLGIRFSNTLYNTSNRFPLDNTASLWVDSVIMDTSNWLLIRWSYTPDNSYKYLYIGNWFDDAHTDTVRLDTVTWLAY